VTGDLWRVTSRHGVLADGHHGGWIDGFMDLWIVGFMIGGLVDWWIVGWPGWPGLDQDADWSGVFENGR